MNRDIKFRVWLPTRQRFAHVRMLGLGTLSYDHGDSEYPELYVHEAGPNSPSSLMQYTGLHDKNGVEIYEGDVVRMIDQYQHGLLFEVPVVWNPHLAAFNVFSDSTYRYDGAEVFSRCEVIGNIYENPEILEVAS